MRDQHRTPERIATNKRIQKDNVVPMEEFSVDLPTLPNDEIPDGYMPAEDW